MNNKILVLALIVLSCSKVLANQYQDQQPNLAGILNQLNQSPGSMNSAMEMARQYMKPEHQQYLDLAKEQPVQNKIGELLNTMQEPMDVTKDECIKIIEDRYAASKKTQASPVAQQPVMDVNQARQAINQFNVNDRQVQNAISPIKAYMACQRKGYVTEYFQAHPELLN